MASFPVAHGGGAAPQLPQANADWQSIVGNLFGNYAAGQQYGQERRVQTGREEVLKNLGPNPDWTLVSQQLLGLGDLKGAGIAADIAQTKENYSFRNQQAGIQNQQWQQQFDRSSVNDQREQANLDRQFELQRRAAMSKGYDIKTVQNPDGSSTLVRVDMATGDAAPIAGAQATASSNPYATGKFNEGQGKAATYADRMATAGSTIDQYDNINAGWKGWAEGLANNVLPETVSNQINSADRQKLIQSQRDFINAILRRESGAVISDAEFDNARKQYFPQPGDKPEVIAQKRENRRIATEGIMREAGPGYRPPKGWAPSVSEISTTKDQSRAPQNAAIGTFGSAPANAAPQPQDAAPQPQARGTLIPGTTNVNGFIYRGGNPNDPNSWVKQ